MSEPVELRTNDSSPITHHLSLITPITYHLSLITPITYHLSHSSLVTRHSSLTTMFFKFTTAGESHGKALISLVEGVPSGTPIDISSVNHELWRRQQGYGRGNRMKIEKDEVVVLSGIRHGAALGSPIALM